MKKYVLIFSVLIYFGGFSFAQEEKAAENHNLTLQAAVDLALERNETVRNAEIDMAIAKKKVLETTAIGLPQVSASASYQYIPGDIPVLDFGSGSSSGTDYTIPDGVSQEYAYQFFLMYGSLMGGLMEPRPIAERHSGNVTLSVNQLIFSGEYIVGLQASKAYKMLSSQSYEVAVADLRESITNTYHMILILQENLSILKKSHENILSIAREMEAMNKAGFIADTDADQIHLTASTLNNAVKSLERQVKVAYNVLKFQLGLPEKDTVELADNLDSFINGLNGGSSYSEEFDPEKNISIQLLETQEKLTALSLKRQKSTVLPTLSGFYMHKELINEPDFSFNIPDMVGINLNVPIWGSGMKLSRIQQAQLELEKVKNQREMAEKGLTLEYSQAIISFNNASEKFVAEKENKDLAEKIYNKTLSKYKEGLCTSMELTQVQNQLFTTQTNYFTAALELLNSRTKLEKLQKTY